jgi:hypothetical protein
VENRWQVIKTTLQNISESVLGYVTSERKEWISAQSWEKIEKRRELKAKLSQGISEEARHQLQEEYSFLDKDIKRSIRRDHRIFLEGMAQRAQEAADRGNMKELFHISRKMTNTAVNLNAPIRSKTGDVVTEVQGQLERWREHFIEVLNSEGSEADDTPLHSSPELQISIRPPSKREILQAINKMKNGKTAGADRIPAEVLKAEPNVSADMLYPLLFDIWNEECFPSDWKEDIIVKIPKKGDLSNCSNWRGTTLLATVGKNFNRIILDRIMEQLQKKIRMEQAGFL